MTCIVKPKLGRCSMLVFAATRAHSMPLSRFAFDYNVLAASLATFVSCLGLECKIYRQSLRVLRSPDQKLP